MIRNVTGEARGAYYNEIDPQAAAWLRELIKQGHIADGEVDERSIEDVAPVDLAGFRQVHMFAGIGGWSYALRLAGWPDDRPIWTGSCPCQPFSAAGQGAGFADERHLWPAFYWLIAQCLPTSIFGEQVASKIADPWIDLVHADLEGMGYAFGCTPFPAAGVGAPNIRDRLYWLADASGTRGAAGLPASARGHERLAGIADDRGGQYAGAGFGPAPGGPDPFRLAAADGGGRQWWWAGEASDGRDAARVEPQRLRDAGGSGRPGPVNGHWRDADWLGCRDGKWRPVEPGTFPLAHGLPARVGRLRGYGNAIVPQAAAEFVRAYCDARGIDLMRAA